MNIFSQPTALQLLRDAEDKKAKVVYGVYLLLGLLFIGMNLFTIVSLVVKISSLAYIPVIVYVITFFYIYIQSLFGYGFFYCKKWIAYILSMHMIFVVFNVTLLLPFMGLTQIIIPTLLASIPYFILFLFVVLTRSFCTPQKGHVAIVISYICIVSILIAINTTLNLFAS